MNRDERLDALKGLLMVLVVLGHVMGTCGTGQLRGYVGTYIYWFHMPLFILISGYFTHIKSSFREFAGGLLGIVCPLIIFQALSFLLLYLYNGRAFPSLLYTPYWTLWYLMSLAFWRIMLQCSPRWLMDRPWVYLGLSVVASMAGGLLPLGDTLALQRTLCFYPFFLTGHFMRRGSFPGRLWPDVVSYAILIAFVFIVAFKLYPPSIGALQRGANTYGVSVLPWKAYVLAGSLLMSLSLFYVMPTVRWLCPIGRDSMLFYLYHALIVKFVLEPAVRRFGLPGEFPFVLLYVVAVMLVLALIGKCKPLRSLAYPKGAFAALHLRDRTKGA
jgi:fucose 4-O-acetylase-like acetyltransferase